MIIFAPRQQFSEPAAEKGPVWSYSTPILIVWPCASARGLDHATTPRARTTMRASDTRTNFMFACPPRTKSALNLARARTAVHAGCDAARPTPCLTVALLGGERGLSCEDHP